MRKHRHWFRGVFGGLLLGLGLGLASMIYAFNAFGPLTPWIMVIIGVFIGIALVFVPRPWGRKKAPTPTTPATPPTTSAEAPPATTA